METLRVLTGSLGVVTVAVLYGVVRHIQRGQDRWLPWLAALLLAIYPPAVLYSRFGFSYNLLAPLVLIVLLALWEYTSSRSKRWLAVASLSIGLGTLCDLWMFVMLVPFALIVLLRHWRDLVWCLPLALLPFGLYVIVMLIGAPAAFWFDARFVLSRLNQLPLDRQLATLAQNAAVLARQDAWMWLGLIGLAVLDRRRFRGIALALFLIPIVLLGRTTALFSLSFYYLIPLLPLVALGVASLIRYGMPLVVEPDSEAAAGRSGVGAGWRVHRGDLIDLDRDVDRSSASWISYGHRSVLAESGRRHAGRAIHQSTDADG